MKNVMILLISFMLAVLWIECSAVEPTIKTKSAIKSVNPTQLPRLPSTQALSESNSTASPSNSTQTSTLSLFDQHIREPISRRSLFFMWIVVGLAVGFLLSRVVKWFSPLVRQYRSGKHDPNTKRYSFKIAYNGENLFGDEDFQIAA